MGSCSKKNVAGSARLRTGRWSEANRIYHVTTRTHERSPVFSDFETARKLICALRHSQKIGHTITLCFVVMPDHLHWLFSLTGERDLSTSVAVIKSLSSRWIRQSGRHIGPLWQPGFHDHALRNDEDAKNVAEYILANPVRAGIVDRVMDYPHWYAIWI